VAAARAPLGLAVALVHVAAEQHPKERVHLGADWCRARDHKASSIQAQPSLNLVEHQRVPEPVRELPRRLQVEGLGSERALKHLRFSAPRCGHPLRDFVEDAVQHSRHGGEDGGAQRDHVVHQPQRVALEKTHARPKRKHIHLNHPLEDVWEREVAEVHIFVRKVGRVRRLQVGHRSHEVRVRDERAFRVPRGAGGVAESGHVVRLRGRVLGAGARRHPFRFQHAHSDHLDIASSSWSAVTVNHDDQLEVWALSRDFEHFVHFGV